MGGSLFIFLSKINYYEQLKLGILKKTRRIVQLNLKSFTLIKISITNFPKSSVASLCVNFVDDAISEAILPCPFLFLNKILYTKFYFCRKKIFSKIFFKYCIDYITELPSYTINL